MNNSDTKMEAILLATDSPELYFPEGFDFGDERVKANRLAQFLQDRLGVSAFVDSPSKFQDGSLFTKIVLRGSEGKIEPVYLLVSAFGRLVTIDGSLSPTSLSATIEVIENCGYCYAPLRELEHEYSGKNSFHRGKSWLNRYFSEWYQ